MEKFFFRRLEYQLRYNCSFMNVNEIPFEKRYHPVHGTILLLLFFIFEVIYVLCIVPIYKHRKNSCYKFMFVMALSDILCLWLNGFLTGLFAFTGAIFCSHPTFIYIAGTIATGLWALESSASILLAMNRCIELALPNLGYTLFLGWRTWIWVAIPCLYGINVTFFSMPVLYSSIYVSWFVNPHVGYIDDFGDKYLNPYVAPHNATVFFGLTGLYALFLLIFTMKKKKYSKSTSQKSNSEKAMFAQVLLISAINAMTSALYLFMQFVRISDFLILCATYTWIAAHGMPGIIYVIMNKTIRNNFIRLFSKNRTKVIAPTSSAKIAHNKLTVLQRHVSEISSTLN